MNDAEYQEVRSYILALKDKWFEPLGLNSWYINLVYDRANEFCATTRADGMVSTEMMKCSVSWKYLEATITLNMLEVYDRLQEDDGKSYVEGAFVHECMHVLVGEMRADTKTDVSHEERVCTLLARAFMSARDAGKEDVTAEKDNDQR